MAKYSNLKPISLFKNQFFLSIIDNSTLYLLLLTLLSNLFTLKSNFQIQI